MSAREKLVDAAFELFEERGFDRTTVDDVAERAGVGRTTFFRHFRAKEDAVLADHPRLLAEVEALLLPVGEDRDDHEELADRVVTAARSVLQHYLDEGERARRRYRLSGVVPAIRSREAAGMRAYQRAFLQTIGEAFGDENEPSLEAELAANSVITATHHVLRRWLREETDTPEADFAAAIVRALAPWLPTSGSPGHADMVPPRLLAAARRTTPLLEQLLDELKALDCD